MKGAPIPVLNLRLGRHLPQFSEYFYTIYGEMRLCVEKRFLLSYPILNQILLRTQLLIRTCLDKKMFLEF